MFEFICNQIFQQKKMYKYETKCYRDCCDNSIKCRKVKPTVEHSFCCVENEMVCLPAIVKPVQKCPAPAPMVVECKHCCKKFCVTISQPKCNPCCD